MGVKELSTMIGRPVKSNGGQFMGLYGTVDDVRQVYGRVQFVVSIPNGAAGDGTPRVKLTAWVDAEQWGTVQ